MANIKILVEGSDSMGVDISFLSRYPDEQEILYPPFTFLIPTMKVEKGDQEDTGEPADIVVRPVFGHLCWLPSAVSVL